MTTSQERPDAIVQRFNEGQANGYSAAFDEIRKAQSENGNFWRDYGRQINDSVDTSALFGKDLEIVGLNSRNEIITTEDGQNFQRRNLRDMSVNSEFSNSADGQLWGNQGRKFQQDAAGNVSYTIKSGDYLDHVVRDILTHKNGTTPTPQEIFKARTEIAAANNITNVNRIGVGTTLKIPDSMRAAGDPLAADYIPPAAFTDIPPQQSALPADKRGMTLDSSRPSHSDGYYSLFSPPGVSADAGYWNTISNFAYFEDSQENRQSTFGPNGRDLKSYDAVIRDSAWGDETKVKVKEEVIQSSGILDKRSVEYIGAAPVTFTVNTMDNGSMELENVKRVDIARAASGSYVSIYTLGDGTKWRGVSSANGTPLSWSRYQS